MSTTPLALIPGWVDAWGDWSSFAEVWAQAIEQTSKCHACRLALVPGTEGQIIPSSGKLNYNFTLVAGSLIVGAWVSPNPEDTVLQITDVALQHKMFQEPIRMTKLQTVGAANGRFPSFTLLRNPYPVVEGLFKAEFWGEPGDRVYLILLVGEVTSCPVR